MTKLAGFLLVFLLTPALLPFPAWAEAPAEMPPAVTEDGSAPVAVAVLREEAGASADKESRVGIG